MTTSDDVLHVLSGDAIVESLSESAISGEVVVCRECLVDGDVSGESLEDFWANRAAFLAKEFGADDYGVRVRDQFLKLKSFEGEVNLWFGNELFCQVNYWFCLSLLQGRPVRAYRVAPSNNEFTCVSDADPTAALAARTPLNESDFELGTELWHAFRFNDADKLTSLGRTEIPAFPLLKEIVDAAIGKDANASNLIRAIVADGVDDFADVFREFSKRAPVYGFGDAQVRRLFEQL